MPFIKSHPTNAQPDDCDLHAHDSTGGTDRRSDFPDIHIDEEDRRSVIAREPAAFLFARMCADQMRQPIPHIDGE